MRTTDKSLEAKADSFPRAQVAASRAISEADDSFDDALAT
jgi:hypothetical protein